MRRAHPIEPLLCVLAAFAFYFPLLLPGRLLPGGDVVNLFWPGKVFLQETLLHGGIVPLWNPYIFFGTPFAASMQHGVFYLPDWPIFFLLPAHAGLHLSLLLHLSAAAVGFWFWLRFAMGAAAFPSVLLGAAFPCVGWFWGHLEHVNQIAATAWMPWMAAVAWMFFAGRISPLRFLCLYNALATFQFLAGHPQEAFYTHLLCAAIFLYHLAITANRREFLRRTVPVSLVAGVVMLLLVSVQLIPAMELKALSKRPYDPPSYALSVSMPPTALVLHVFPNFWGSWREGFSDGAPEGVVTAEYGPYVGLPILLLAAGALFLARDRRRDAVFLLLLALLATVLALGGNSDPRRLLAWDFSEFPEPGWSLHDLFLRIAAPAQGFRVPARILILASFALCTLAALSIQALASRPIAQQRLLGAALVLAIAASLAWPARFARFHGVAEVPELPTFSPMRIYRLTVSDDARLLRERVRYPLSESGASVHERLSVMQPNTSMIAGVMQVEGYEEGLLPTARTADFLARFNRNLRQQRPDPTLLALLGVDFLLSDLPVDESVYTREESPYPGWSLYSLPVTLGSAIPGSSIKGIDLRLLDAALDDPERRPFERGDLAVPLPSLTVDSPPTMTVIRPDINRLLIVDSLPPENAVVVLGAYPGWAISAEQPVEFQNAIHARLPAESGPRWELAFRPPSYRTGLFLSALGALIWGASAGAGLRRRRERRLTGTAPAP